MSKQAFKRVRKSLSLDVSREPLPAFAWPGGYQMYYVCADGGSLCPDCVSKEIDLVAAALTDPWDKQWRVLAAEVNYEDTELTCDHCNQPILAAYAD